MTPLGPHVRVVFPLRPVVSLRSKTPETFEPFTFLDPAHPFSKPPGEISTASKSEKVSRAEHLRESLANRYCVAPPTLGYITRHLAKVANAFPGVSSGLRDSSKTETLSKST